MLCVLIIKIRKFFLFLLIFTFFSSGASDCFVKSSCLNALNQKLNAIPKICNQAISQGRTCCSGVCSKPFSNLFNQELGNLTDTGKCQENLNQAESLRGGLCEESEKFCKETCNKALKNFKKAYRECFKIQGITQSIEIAKSFGQKFLTEAEKRIKSCDNEIKDINSMYKFHNKGYSLRDDSSYLDFTDCDVQTKISQSVKNKLGCKKFSINLQLGSGGGAQNQSSHTNDSSSFNVISDSLPSINTSANTNHLKGKENSSRSLSQNAQSLNDNTGQGITNKIYRNPEEELMQRILEEDRDAYEAKSEEIYRASLSNLTREEKIEIIKEIDCENFPEIEFVTVFQSVVAPQKEIHRDQLYTNNLYDNYDLVRKKPAFVHVKLKKTKQKRFSWRCAFRDEDQWRSSRSQLL